MPNYRFFRTGIAFVAASLTAMAIAAPDPVLIGIVSPMTGSTAEYGTEVQEGVLTAMDTFNAAGGLGGRPYKAVLIDDGCDAKKAVQAANEVIASGIKFAIGPVCSGAAASAAKMYAKEGIVTITPGATAPEVTDDIKSHYFFRTIGRDDLQGTYIATVIIAHLKAKKTALLHDGDTYGAGITQTVKESLGSFGASIVLHEAIEPGAKDYSKIIAKLKSLGPDVVFFGGYTAEMGLLLRQAKEQGLETRFIGPEGVYSLSLLDIAGSAIDGLLFISPVDFSARPNNKAIVQAFQKAKRPANGNYQMTAYAAMQVLHESMKTVGTDPKKVADHMHANRFITSIGPVAFNNKGDLKNFDFAVFELDKNGNRKVIR